MVLYMRLLLVEDDGKLVGALERGLGLEGYDVDVATTGDEAVSRGSTENYDAILLDLMLPGLDSWVLDRSRRHGAAQ